MENRDLMCMTTGHRQALVCNRCLLIREITNPIALVDYLRDQKVIGEESGELILAEITRRRQVAAILDLLPKRPDSAFLHFCNGLRYSGCIAIDQNTIADLIEKASF